MDRDKHPVTEMNWYSPSQREHDTLAQHLQSGYHNVPEAWLKPLDELRALHDADKDAHSE